MDDSIEVVAGTTFELPAPGVLVNDENIAPGAVVQWQTTPPEGLTLRADGGIDYEVPVDASGTASFQYCILDLPGTPAARCISNLATVTVHIASPVLVDDSIEVVAGTTFELPAPGVLVNDENIAPGAVVQWQTTPPEGLTLRADGGIDYEVPVDASGTASFQYCILDLPGTPAARCISNLATVTVTVVTELPLTLRDDEYSVVEGEVLQVDDPGVLANDDLPDGYELVVTCDQPDDAELTCDQGGGFTLTPDDGFTGDITFGYGIGPLSADRATVTVHVTASNPPGDDDGAVGDESPGGDDGTDGNDTPGGDESGDGGASGADEQGSDDGDDDLPDTGVALPLWLLTGAGLVGAGLVAAAGRRRLS
ncbi:hypothetical protein C1I92_31035 [Jiangella anatolica]|uniref:Gram-positive cocci surface proteins LPxTG domain-containing protein n=1 Tax=Jiangella anatolica TaxID=2670374 RepID=A0A2W2C127_9ACTN|nr:hypothetical protein C1I92_31035 [Jiangella anatolica]